MTGKWELSMGLGNQISDSRLKIPLSWRFATAGHFATVVARIYEHFTFLGNYFLLESWGDSWMAVNSDLSQTTSNSRLSKAAFTSSKHASPHKSWNIRNCWLSWIMQKIPEGGWTGLAQNITDKKCNNWWTGRAKAILRQQSKVEGTNFRFLVFIIDCCFRKLLYISSYLPMPL